MPHRSRDKTPESGPVPELRVMKECLRALEGLGATNLQIVEQLGELNRQGNPCSAARGEEGEPSPERREYLEFKKMCPRFNRSCMQWEDFAQRFVGAQQDHGVTDQQAKWILYTAIEGQDSRLVLSGMNPNSEKMCRPIYTLNTNYFGGHIQKHPSGK